MKVSEGKRREGGKLRERIWRNREKEKGVKKSERKGKEDYRKEGKLSEVKGGKGVK